MLRLLLSRDLDIVTSTIWLNQLQECEKLNKLGQVSLKSPSIL